MSLTCHVVESSNEFLALRAAWNELLVDGRAPSPFLTWEWMYAWWLHYGLPDPRKRLAIVTAHEGQKLVALLPGYLHEAGFPGSPVKTLAFLGTPYESSDYLEVIQRDPGRTDTLASVVQFVQSNICADRVTFGNVLSSSTTSTFLRDGASAIGVSCETYHLRSCPYLPITGEWSEYQAGLSTNFRQTLRRRTRRFFERDGAEFDWVLDRTEISRAVQTLFDLHQRRFAQKNARTEFVADRRGEFHANVSKWLFDRNLLRFFRLKVRGDTVATLYCFEYAGRLFYYQGGIDPFWDRDSVGTVLMGQVIKYAFDRRLTLFDFMRGTEEYKFRWTNRTREIVLLDVGLTRKGKSLVALAKTTSAAKCRAKSLVQLARRSAGTGLWCLGHLGRRAPAPIAETGRG